VKPTIESLRARVSRLRAKLVLPEIFRKQTRQRIPDTDVVGRTGEARFTPQMARWDRRTGDTVCVAHRWDEITYRDYDRVRFYPVVRDAIKALMIPVARVNFHFSCPRQEVADLAAQELDGPIRSLLKDLAAGGLQFGRHTCIKRWRPKFEVVVTSGQSNTGANSERYYPFIWTIGRFANLDPRDTMVLIKGSNGQFWGVKELLPDARIRPGEEGIPARRLVHYVHDREYDSLYGIPRTKTVVPFVDLASALLDDMATWSGLYANGWIVGRYPEGRTGQPGAGDTPNADIMSNLIGSVESGYRISLPSNRDEHGQPRWDLVAQFMPSGSEAYVPKIEFLNQQIRLGMVVPEMASSQSPDTGTYNLGETVIDLFLQNVEAMLDELAAVINEQVLRDFVLYNFGADCPDLQIVMEPVDIKVRHALLKSLLDMIGSGAPITDGEGTQYEPDWPKLAEDNGVPLRKIDPAVQMEQMRQALQAQLGMGGPGGEGGPPGGSGGQDPFGAEEDDPLASMALHDPRRGLALTTDAELYE